MKEKIRKICSQLNDGQMAVSTATNELLLLFNVSGNEANQSANKKDGEVALPTNEDIVKWSKEYSEDINDQAKFRVMAKFMRICMRQ